MADLPRPAVRRPLSITILSLSFFVMLVLTPIVLPVVAIVDVARRGPMRRSRIWLLYLFILGNEGLGTWLAIAMTAAHLGRLDRPTAQRRFHRLMVWWGGRHIDNLRWFAGLRWLVENPDDVRDANAIVLARHGSHADAILPILLFTHKGGHDIRYTLKDDLQWSPAMDIVGNRLPHVFVDRAPGDDSPLAGQIRDLATGVDDHTVTVIFPEGTFYTPERLERAVARIADTRPELEATARSLRHLLPPRPAGTLALMAGAPDADLVLVAHAGMEAFGDLKEIMANLPLPDPVRVRVWRIPRADVPDADAFAPWLLDRWVEMDDWIQACVVGPAPSIPPTALEFRP